MSVSLRGMVVHGAAALLCLCLIGRTSHAHAVTPDVEETQGRSDCVILLHGLGRTAHSLAKMERALSAAGFWTVNVDYPSRKHPIRELAETFMPPALERCAERGRRPIHFVTHSMGGIVLRAYLARNRLAQPGRVVMLSPPNEGSEAADFLKDSALYRWFNGPAGQELTTDAQSLPRRLGAVDYPVGVITGNRHAFFDAWLAQRIPGEDDGKVSVERAKVDGMTDFLVLPHAHTFIMDQDDVIDETIRFLETGAFSARSSDPEPPMR